MNAERGSADASPGSHYALWKEKPRGDDPQKGVCSDANDGHVEDRHTSLHSFFSSRVGLRPTLEGTSYVYTVNVTSMLLDIVLFINVSIVMYIMTIK